MKTGPGRQPRGARAATVSSGPASQRAPSGPIPPIRRSTRPNRNEEQQKRRYEAPLSRALSDQFESPRIGSEAKVSRAAAAALRPLDCFVASLLAKTVWCDREPL